MRVAPSRLNFVLAHALAGTLTLLAAPSSARAQAVTASTTLRKRGVEGLGPDAQLTGGIGFGFEAKLQNFFLARARLGVLYAAQPWIANLGFSAEVGALAGLGWGAELELSRSGTLFGTAGISRVDEARWLAHLGVGFTIFGLEWQHVFGGSEPHNALLLEVRLPLGLWWLHQRQEKAEAESTAATTPPAPPHIVQRPTSNPAPLSPGARPAPAQTPYPAADSGEPVAATSGAAAASGRQRAAADDVAAREAELAARLADAHDAHALGDHLAEVVALARAYALRPEPALALQLSAAELALGKPRSALADWQRLPAIEQLSAEDRARATELGQQISAAVAQLRLSLSGAISEQDVVRIDGAVEPTATRGYDVPLDPGEHKLQLLRGQHVLLERAFRAEPGKLVRVELELPAE